MGKVIFKGGESTQLSRKVVYLEAPPQVIIRKEEEEVALLKTVKEEIAELQAEKERLAEQAKKEAEQIIASAKAESEAIIKQAEDGAFEIIQRAIKKAKEEAEVIMMEVDRERIKKEQECEQLIREAQTKADDIRLEAEKRGYEKGYREGYESGRAEVQRLINRLNVIIEGAIDKREQIINSAEEQVIRIVLMAARKVIKALSEEHKGVVIENIKAALKKISGKAEVIIRVNAQDLELATEHKEEFLGLMEGLRHVVVLEDSRVDRGGCIIETDFGSVDARISTQLEEIEEKIRELAQLKYFEKPL